MEHTYVAIETSQLNYGREGGSGERGEGVGLPWWLGLYGGCGCMVVLLAMVILCVCVCVCVCLSVCVFYKGTRFRGMKRRKSHQAS